MRFEMRLEGVVGGEKLDAIWERVGKTRTSIYWKPLAVKEISEPRFVKKMSRIKRQRVRVKRWRRIERCRDLQDMYRKVDNKQVWL